MSRTVGLLCVAAIIGIVMATAITCGVGLVSGSSTWCGLPLYLIVGGLPAMASAVVLGFPASLLFRRLGLRRWWQFVLGGTVFALPVWYELAEPFASARWLSAGFFDSLNYLGSGAFAGLVFWWLSIKVYGKNAL